MSSEPWVPGQLLRTSLLPSVKLNVHIQHHSCSYNCDNVWDIKSFVLLLPASIFFHKHNQQFCITGPFFSFICTQNSPPTLSRMTTEEALWSDQGQRSSPLFYESDSTESRHQSDDYLATMGLHFYLPSLTERTKLYMPLSVFLVFKRTFCLIANNDHSNTSCTFLFEILKRNLERVGQTFMSVFDRIYIMTIEFFQ